MNKKIQTINEQNFSKIFATLYAENNCYTRTYDTIKKMVGKIEKYASIRDNYTSLFVYELVEKQIPILEYSNTIKHIMEQGQLDIWRFFTHDYDMENVIADGKKVKSNSVWDNMATLFYNVENEHLVFDKQNINYLIPIFEHMNVNSIEKFHESLFTYQFSFKLGDLKQQEECIQLLNVIRKNPAFEAEKEQYYRSFYNTLVEYVGGNAYEWDATKTNNAICCLDLSYTNNKERLMTFLIKKDPNEKNNMKIELTSRFFISYLGVNEFITNIKHTYNEKLNESNGDFLKIYTLMNTTKNTLMSNYDKPLNIDFNNLFNLDSKNFVAEHFIELIFLDAGLKIQHIPLEKQLAKKILELIVDEVNLNIKEPNNMLQHYEPDDYNTMKKFLEQNILDSSLNINYKKKTTHKI